VTLPPQQPAVPFSDGPASGGPRWGLGDVVTGILVAMVSSILVGSLIYGIAGWESSDQVPIWGLGLLQVPLWAGYLGVTVWAASTKGGGVVSDLGLRATSADAPVGLLAGVLAQLLLLPALYIPIFWLTGTDADELSEPARQLADRAGSVPSWLLFAVLVGICAPVVEELFYRGLFLRSLTKRGMPPVAAVVLSSAIFAAIHFQVLQFVGLFAFGLIAGALAERTGRLGSAIWAHIGFNLSTVVLLYLGS